MRANPGTPLSISLALVCGLIFLSGCIDTRIGTNNSAPEASIELPAPGTEAVVGSEVLFRGVGEDRTTVSEELEVLWVSSLDGELHTGTADSEGRSVFSSAELSVGAHLITFTVRDGQGASSSDDRELLVVNIPNTPPECSFTTPTAGTIVGIGQSILLSGTATDLETASDSLSLTLTSSLGGGVGAVAADSAGIWSLDVADLEAGNHGLNLLVEDPDGGTCEAEVTLFVNDTPTAPTVAIQPVGPGTADDLVATVTTSSIDADGGPEAITYTMSWTRDGTPVGPFATTDTVPAAETAMGEVWVVSVVASDGHASSAEGSASVTIGNTPPSVDAVSISPSSAYTTTPLTAVPGTWADVDGDSENYLYEWSVNSVPAGTDSAILDPSWFVKGQSVGVTITPQDATSSGLSVSSGSITILNTPPGPPAIAISPSGSASPDDDLICEVVAPGSDDDNDSLTYFMTWTMNGLPWTGGSLTTTNPGDTIPSSSTSEGELWECSATSYDGSDASSAVVDSVQISTCSGSTTVSVFADESVSVSYPNNQVWNDNRVRAYTSGSLDVVGWMSFDLSNLASSDTITAATLHLHEEWGSVSGTPYMEVVESTASSWTRAGVAGASSLPRGAAVSAQFTSFSIGSWNSFPLDVSLWDWTADIASGGASLGIDNTNSAYTYVYFHGPDVAAMTPELELVVDSCN